MLLEQVTERIEVVVGDGHHAWHEGAELIARAVVAGEGHDSDGATVEATK